MDEMQDPRKGPVGSVATIVFASKNSEPSAFRKSEVWFFQSGPSSERPNRRCCSGPRNLRERLAGTQRLVTKTKVERAVPRIDPGLGDDVDKAKTGIVILCGVRVEPESYLANLGLRRQLSTAKSVDAHLRAGPGELIDRVLEFIRVVRKLGYLIRGQARL